MAADKIDCRSHAGAVPLIPAWVAKYVGVPFKEYGYDIDGWNCWGAVHVIFGREAGVNVPAYAEVSYRDLAKSDALFTLQSVRGDPWVQVTAPLRVFDVALLRGRPMHVGVMLNENAMLHVWRKTGTVIMPIDHVRIRNHIIGFFRHRELAA